jgi:hypothetical protein
LVLRLGITPIDVCITFVTIIPMHAPARQPHSFRLFARPTFLEGAARIFDFTSVLQNYRSDATEAEADTNALRSDWMAVGDDIRQALMS